MPIAYTQTYLYCLYLRCLYLYSLHTAILPVPIPVPPIPIPLLPTPTRAVVRHHHVACHGQVLVRLGARMSQLWRQLCHAAHAVPTLQHMHLSCNSCVHGTTLVHSRQHVARPPINAWHLSLADAVALWFWLWPVAFAFAFAPLFHNTSLWHMQALQRMHVTYLPVLPPDSPPTCRRSRPAFDTADG